MLISVIVPNYQGKKIFPDCVKSLLKQSFKSYEIIFADDGSTDGSHELAKELFGRKIKILRREKNTGYVGICNYALKFCKGKYITILNNDSTVPNNWLREMYRTVEGKKKVIGGSIVLQGSQGKTLLKKIKQGKFHTESVAGFAGGWRKLIPEERKTGLIESTAAGIFIVPRNALSGYIFEKDYFAYGEDNELCWRLRLRGYHLVYNSKAHMYHYGSFTRKKVSSFNRLAIYHGTKNTIVNFLIFYEAKNVIKLALPFTMTQLIRFFMGPRAAYLRIKSYWWVLTHFGEIMKRRKRHQRARVADDNEMMRLMSYKIYDENLARNSLVRVFVKLSNWKMRMYCTLVGIRTFDMDDSTPEIHVPSVRAKTI